ncbi:MAG: YceI family protein [Flavobacteriales bacterium]|jgi:polyisoprenoid-binding protein YceI|nr:YceI family protein [Flavobacteriales bacterium]
MHITIRPATLILALSMAALAGAQTLAVDPARSTVEWAAAKMTGSHNGTVGIRSGSITIDNGILGTADLVVDMDAITCADVTNPGANAKLVAHLKSDDFFSTEQHATATFRTTTVEAVPTEREGRLYNVTGDLTIKGITHPAVFQCHVAEADGGVHAHGSLTFDRTKYDVKYRSGAFFEGLGDKLIHDEVQLGFDLRTK